MFWLGNIIWLGLANSHGAEMHPFHNATVTLTDAILLAALVTCTPELFHFFTPSLALLQ